MTKLEKMLKYVSEHNEFYKNRIKEYGIKDPLDITQWPVLTREELQENRYNMFSDGYKSKYFNQQLRRQSSSGSSGVPVNVYWDYKDWYASNMSLWRKRLQWYGIHPSDKYVIFTLSAFEIEHNADMRYQIQVGNTLLINISMIHNECGYLQIAKQICDFNPVWLYIQPTVLSRLINIYMEHNINPPTSLKYIESVGEVLTLDLRNKARDFFNVTVANMYGSEEMNGIAYECPKGHMHILTDNVHLDVYSSQAIVSNLNNKGMPLIRYAQGDIISLKEMVLCEFDTNPIVIENIYGRTYETIIVDNIEINGFTLKEIIAEVNNEFQDAIVEYKYEYNQHIRALLCYIKVQNDKIAWFNSINNAIKKVFDRKIPKGCVDISVIHMDDYEYSSSKQIVKIIKEENNVR